MEFGVEVKSEQLKMLHEPLDRGVVSWRAQMVTKDKSSALALAYLDSRDIQDRLDEVCGPQNWQCKHYDANGKMACSIGIRINGEWIWKSDGAGDTDIEAEKGAFSGAMKRAAVLWGIGRYLYDMKAVWVPCETGPNGKFKRFTKDPWTCVKGTQKFAPAKQSAKPQEQKKTIDKLPKNKEASDLYENAIQSIKDCVTVPELNEYFDKYRGTLSRLPDDYLQGIGNQKKERIGELENPNVTMVG